MKILKDLIMPILVGLVVCYFGFVLNYQKVDIRYTLSDGIPIATQDQSITNNVQQLVVKNLGNEKAEKILVNIDGNIVDYTLFKYAEVDKYQTYIKNEGIQIIYPELPPEGSFKIVIQSQEGVKINDVRITHSKGEAIEALSSDKKSNSFIILPCIYILLILLFARNIYIDFLESSAGYSSKYMKILEKKNSPILISRAKWSRIRQIACETLIKDNTSRNFNNIETSKCYLFLSKEPLKYLNEDEYNQIVKTLKEQLIKDISDKVKYIFSELEDIISLLKLTKPKAVTEDEWFKIRKELIYQMKLVLKNQDFYMKIHLTNLYQFFNKDKPDYLNEEEWLRITSELSGNLEVLIKREVAGINTLQEMKYFLELTRPKSFEVPKWDYILEAIYKKYVNIKKGELTQNILLLDNQAIMQELEKSREEIIPEKYWREYTQYLSSAYTAHVMLNLYKQKDPIHFLSYQKKEFLKNFRDLSINAYNIKLVDFYINNLNKDYRDFLIVERPDWIKEADYNTISKYLKCKDELDVLIEENQQNSHELQEEREITEKLRTKINFQLDTIDKLLRQPASIERIEDYNNEFSKENFNNLKKVFHLLNDK